MTRRHRPALSLVDHIGDSPFAELVIGLFLLCLLPADFYNLDIMLQGATNQAPLAGHVIALVLALAIPATLAVATLLMIQGIRLARRLVIGSGALLAGVWIYAVIVTYLFRQSNDSALTSGSAPTVGVHVAPATGGTDPSMAASSHAGGGLAALLTVLLVLTSLLAAALAGIRVDAEQLKRRRVARRLLWLRWHHRRHLARADRADKAAELQRVEITKTEDAFGHAAGQLEHWAARHKHTVRLTLAKSGGDPATTSALMADQRDW